MRLLSILLGPGNRLAACLRRDDDFSGAGVPVHRPGPMPQIQTVRELRDLLNQREFDDHLEKTIKIKIPGHPTEAELSEIESSDDAVRLKAKWTNGII